jgi:hypothetical protein
MLGSQLLLSGFLKYSTLFLLCIRRISEKTWTQGDERSFKHSPYRYIKVYARNIFIIGGWQLKAGANILFNLRGTARRRERGFPVFMLNNTPGSFAAIVMARQKKIFILFQEIGLMYNVFVFVS